MRDIHKEIKDNYDFENIPEFPAKKWLGNTDKSFISSRKKALENYFNTILKFHDIDTLKPLYNFLCANRQSKGSPII
jgi:hypothetical protein